MKKKRPTIAELERILNSEEERDIRIMPDGSIKAVKRRTKKSDKPLTMRENLGGEYAY